MSKIPGQCPVRETLRLGLYLKSQVSRLPNSHNTPRCEHLPALPFVLTCQSSHRSRLGCPSRLLPYEEVSTRFNPTPPVRKYGVQVVSNLRQWSPFPRLKPVPATEVDSAESFS